MIDVKGLTKRFGTVTALDNISFQVDSGSIFGLVGSNGAGKSTFLRTAAGIYRPAAGSVLIDGGEPFENLSVKENVCFISDYPVSYTHLVKFLYPKHGRRYPVCPSSPYANSGQRPAARNAPGKLPSGKLPKDRSASGGRRQNASRQNAQPSL